MYAWVAELLRVQLMNFFLLFYTHHGAKVRSLLTVVVGEKRTEFMFYHFHFSDVRTQLAATAIENRNVSDGEKKGANFISSIGNNSF